MLNPISNPILNPILNPLLNPKLNLMMNPIMNQILNPNIKPKIEPNIESNQILKQTRKKFTFPKFTYSGCMCRCTQFFSAWCPPSQCSSVPLPHSALSWILSKVDNLASYSLQPIHSDTWPQLNDQSSSTFIY